MRIQRKFILNRQIAKTINGPTNMFVMINKILHRIIGFDANYDELILY